MNKNELRKRMADIVSHLSCLEKQEQSKVVLRRLTQHPRYIEAKRLSIYLSTENEINTKPILEQALEANNKQCFIPFVRKTRKITTTTTKKLADDDNGDKFGTRMLMVRLKSMQEFERLPVNNYGIKEHEDPLNDKSIEIAGTLGEDNDLDLVIVPGVAFATDGRRLGHGKGYYDEFLSKLTIKSNKTSQRRPYTIGLAFREQLVEDPLAVVGHDFKLDEVLYAP